MSRSDGTKRRKSADAFAEGSFDSDDLAVGTIEVPEPGTASPNDKRAKKRVRQGKRWTEITENVRLGHYTWEEFAASLKPAELARGQLMDSRGGFTGRPPTLVPRAFHDACVRELMKRGREMYKENYIQAIQAMTDIATNKAVKEADRIKAATFVIERLEGKVPERLEVVASAPWQDMIGGIVADVPDGAAVANAQTYDERRGNESTDGS